jgi:hypothetical protein
MWQSTGTFAKDQIRDKERKSHSKRKENEEARRTGSRKAI